MADSKLSAFLSSKKVDGRRLLAASHKLETLTRGDRAIKLAKRKKAGEEAAEGAPKETRKPRSGRPVTARALDAALHGREISGPVKTRILRAINHILEQKKQKTVVLKELF